ncbi:MAG: putative extracellular nuclease [Flavobacteriaceae bacterium]|jgi:predicted extracellular nuclease
MYKGYLLLSYFILLTISLSAQSTRTIAFYNVENLFDTLDTQGKIDEEYLPSSKREWTSERYLEKIEHINEVLDSLHTPLVVGLCEIENKAVVEDIVAYGKMKSTHNVVHFESADARGIDNAIIYDSTVLMLVDKGAIRFDMPPPSTPSRDIVWAKFQHGKDQIIVMVNHWPSRRGGQAESEPKRMIAAISAKEFINAQLTANKKVKIILMGDLNDYPENRAPLMISDILKPLITEKSGDFGGSHSYRNEWGVLDHIMVSKSFIKKKGIKVKKKSGKIHSPDFLLGEYRGNIVPNRTYGGVKYLGGYSDHFPVSVEVKIK